MLLQGAEQPRARDRLDGIGVGAERPALPLVFHRGDHQDRNAFRGVLLSVRQKHPGITPGQQHIQDNRLRPHPHQGLLGLAERPHWEGLKAGPLEELLIDELRLHMVLHDSTGTRAGSRTHASAAASGAVLASRYCKGMVAENVEPTPGAAQRHAPAQQFRELFAERQPKPVPFTRCCKGMRNLDELLKDGLLIFRGNADAGIGHGKDHRIAGGRQRGRDPDVPAR